MPRRFAPWLAAAAGGAIGTLAAILVGAPGGVIIAAQFAVGLLAYWLVKRQLGSM